MRRSSIAVLSSAMLLSGVSSVCAQDIIAVSWPGTVYAADSSTGSGNQLGSSGWDRMNSMARDGSGRLLAASNGDLIEIDPLTGSGSFVVTMSGITDSRGMAYHDGSLFVVQDTGFGSFDDLYRVDVETGDATFVGNTGYPGIQGLASNGVTLYAWDVGSGSGIGAGLVEIDAATGVGVDVNPDVDGSGNDGQALAFSPDGTLYAMRDSLFTVDTSTGEVTFVGSGGYADVRGFDFMGEPGPTLAVSGNCPGQVTLTVENATPGGSVAFVYAFGTGSFSIPNNFPCAGTELGLNNTVQLAATVNADGSGVATLSRNVPDAACGRVFVQAIDIGSCGTTNVEGL